MKAALHALSAPAPALPAYVPSGNECALFEHAWRHQLPVLLKGPTGCGKTRFVAHMAARLGLPLHTVACHDDLTAADLTGRYLLRGGDTVWTDGPLTRAVREGGICYLDEVVEARKDVTVVLHPLTDDRRILPLERTGEELVAPNELHARGLLQSRLPDAAEGAEAVDAPALRRHRVRLPAAGAGDRGGRGRKRARRPTMCGRWSCWPAGCAR